MSKQDKKIKKQKKAEAKAQEIIAQATTAVLSSKTQDVEWADERDPKASDEQFVLGCRVRELREAGEPWWAIARDLELEGAGNSATTGKKGASRARQAYTKAFGSHPRTFKTGVYKGKQETNETVKEMKKAKRADLRAQAKAGKAVISLDMPPEEIASLLKGRRIKWFSNEFVPDGMDYEACVHPKHAMYIYEEAGELVVQFREQHRRAPIEYRMVPGQIRVVRLRQIYSVK